MKSRSELNARDRRWAAQDFRAAEWAEANAIELQVAGIAKGVVQP